MAESALRLATFNLENLGGRRPDEPGLDARISALRPQLERLQADVLCLQEVNGQDLPGHNRELRALDALLAGTAYAGYHRVATTGNSGTRPRDKQNLVILSRLPILDSAQHMHDLVPAPHYPPTTGAMADRGPANDGVTWERPLLHAAVDLGDGRTLHVVNLHLRAPIPVAIDGQKQTAWVWRSVAGWAEGMFLADVKRSGQALEARLLVERLFDADPEALVAVCGDYNAEAGDAPLAILRSDVEDTGNPALAARVLVPIELNLPADRRFTVRHYGRNLMLDHILVSRPLLAHFRDATVHNEMLTDELVAFMQGRHDADSFHAPLLATFDFA
jgi:endonuclease/exonuclease/phosphatase family metal-dependent hydrolase